MFTHKPNTGQKVIRTTQDVLIKYQWSSEQEESLFQLREQENKENEIQRASIRGCPKEWVPSG